MMIETERLVITEYTMDMAALVQANSVDEDNRRFVPDEVWETVEVDLRSFSVEPASIRMRTS